MKTNHPIKTILVDNPSQQPDGAYVQAFNEDLYSEQELGDALTINEYEVVYEWKVSPTMTLLALADISKYSVNT